MGRYPCDLFDSGAWVAQACRTVSMPPAANGVTHPQPVMTMESLKPKPRKRQNIKKSKRQKAQKSRNVESAILNF
jgi:hypothetical protein